MLSRELDMSYNFFRIEVEAGNALTSLRLCDQRLSVRRAGSNFSRARERMKGGTESVARRLSAF